MAFVATAFIDFFLATNRQYCGLRAGAAAAHEQLIEFSSKRKD